MASDALFDVVDMVVNRPTRFSRLTQEEKQAHEERMAALLAMDDVGEEEDPFQDDDDVEADNDYVPEDASDAEQELELEEDEDEDEGALDEEEEDLGMVRLEEIEAVQAAVPVDRMPAGEYYSCKDGFIWTHEPPPPGRPQSHNIVVAARQGPIRSFLANPMAIFKQIVTPEMVNIIVRQTNRKAKDIIDNWNWNHSASKPKVWEPTNEKEMYAFFGLLLYSGLFKTNTQPTKELWAPYHFDLFKATMSLKRYNILLRYIRFDDGTTRAQRLLTSKSAAIDDIWLMMSANLERAYVPGANLTVDEQLFPFRGRTRFTQYIPSKPAKYGIKIWWICDAKSHYPLKGRIYTGKLEGAVRDINQGERVVLSLVQKYNNSGRTIYCDNFFTTFKLATNLMELKLAIVGTVRANKRFVPSDFRKSKTRPVFETLFGFHMDRYALCSYVPKKDKAVILLSTEHYTRAVDENTEARKPHQILDYNANKAGVDTMDQMVGGYTCKRGTNRWPLALFYNILDVSGLASFIIYDSLVPSKKSDKRRAFMVNLCHQLAIPHMEDRAMKPLVTRFPNIKRAMEKFNVIVSKQTKNQTSILVSNSLLLVLFFYLHRYQMLLLQPQLRTLQTNHQQRYPAVIVHGAQKTRPRKPAAKHSIHVMFATNTCVPSMVPSSVHAIATTVLPQPWQINVYHTHTYTYYVIFFIFTCHILHGIQIK